MNLSRKEFLSTRSPARYYLGVTRDFINEAYKEYGILGTLDFAANFGLNNIPGVLERRVYKRRLELGQTPSQAKQAALKCTAARTTAYALTPFGGLPAITLAIQAREGLNLLFLRKLYNSQPLTDNEGDELCQLAKCAEENVTHGPTKLRVRN